MTQQELDAVIDGQLSADLGLGPDVWDTPGRVTAAPWREDSRRRRYRAGTAYRLYRDDRTGRLLRPPTGREIAAVPLALLPLLFFGMMTLSMLLSAAGLLLCAALSAPLP